MISCKKEEIFQENYNIGVKNNYFEAIDSIKIGSATFNKSLSVGETSFFKEKFSISSYSVKLYTTSNLIITTKFKAISHKNTILLTLISDGTILID